MTTIYDDELGLIPDIDETMTQQERDVIERAYEERLAKYYRLREEPMDIALNAGPGNPYRDKVGRFASGPGGASIASTNEAADTLTAGNQALASANTGSAVSKQVENQRAAVAKYLTENGGDIEAFKQYNKEGKATDTWLYICHD